LPDPEAEYGEFYNPSIISFERIAHVPCLALLGEPGMGKSKILKEQYAITDQQVRATGDRASSSICEHTRPTSCFIKPSSRIWLSKPGAMDRTSCTFFLIAWMKHDYELAL
jgi:hypothetical protein